MPEFAAPRSVDLSPVSLSYAAALRGVKPRAPGTAFAYAHVNPAEVHELICRAASNPEGRFFGIMDNDAGAEKAKELAASRHAENISFLAAPLEQIEKQQAMPRLDYLIWDVTENPDAWAEREPLFAFAEKAVKPNGLFVCSYRAYANPDEILRFLVSEFSPAMNADEAKAFLPEIKALGASYFADHSITRTALDRAMANGKPEEFFKACESGEKPVSGTLDVMAGLLPRRFAYAGGADIGANYMELATPPEAHEVLEKCRAHLLYEPIKDFAMNRLVRHDIWCRLPADQTSDTSVLFGPFTYGIIKPANEIPAVIRAMEKTIDLRQPLLAGIIEVMTVLPMSIGDFLQHPKGQGVNPAEAVAAFQILVATGLAQPMRSHHQSAGAVQIAQLKWATAFNRRLNETPITSPRVLLASEVIGSGVAVAARDALVMQAINRVGLADSTGAVLLELERIAHDPALAASIMDAAEPTPEIAENMVKDVIERSMAQWYAYGILAA
jgi:hypothetical protein